MASGEHYNLNYLNTSTSTGCCTPYTWTTPSYTYCYTTPESLKEGLKKLYKKCPNKDCKDGLVFVETGTKALGGHKKFYTKELCPECLGHAKVLTEEGKKTMGLLKELLQMENGELTIPKEFTK